MKCGCDNRNGPYRKHDFRAKLTLNNLQDEGILLYIYFQKLKIHDLATRQRHMRFCT
jgi:hypothetical protein